MEGFVVVLVFIYRNAIFPSWRQTILRFFLLTWNECLHVFTKMIIHSSDSADTHRGSVSLACCLEISGGFFSLEWNFLSGRF